MLTEFKAPPLVTPHFVFRAQPGYQDQDSYPALALTRRNLVGPRRSEYVTDHVPAIPVIIERSVLLSARWKL